MQGQPTALVTNGKTLRVRGVVEVYKNGWLESGLFVVFVEPRVLS